MTDSNDRNDNDNTDNAEKRICDDILKQEFDVGTDEIDKNFFQRAATVMATRSRGMYIITLGTYSIFIGLFLYIAYNYFTAVNPGDVTFWGINTVLCAIVSVGVELWFWMEMNRASLLREIKRMELQVSLLTEKFVKD